MPKELSDLELDRVSGGADSDEQLANVDLQSALQRRTQTSQMLSNIAKMLGDTFGAVIRKINS
jgi:hypothetical protein